MNEEGSYFSKTYNLLCTTRGLNLSDENAPLTHLQYHLRHGSVPNSGYLAHYWLKCHIAGGWYNQRPWRDGGKEDLMSPDQLIALVCFNYKTGRHLANQLIWETLRKHWLTYNNVTRKVDFKRIMQPMAILTAWFAATDNKLAGLLLRSACIIACAAPKEDTSGKLKSWTIYSSFDWWMGRLDIDWEEVWNTYYHQEEHPLRSK